MANRLTDCRRSVIVLAALVAVVATTTAQDKKDVPRITAIAPMSVTAGSVANLVVRGLKLDSATEIRFPGWPALKAELKEKKKAALPNGLEAKDVGDTQFEASVTFPADLPLGTLAVEVVTPAGTTETREISVVEAATRVDEKEPNNGFTEAQIFELGKTVRGQVKEDRDVDVYAVNVSTGQALLIEVTASRRSSMLDPLISIFDEKRRLLRVVDDASSRDPVLTFAVPSAGKYFIVLQDAGDRGGTWHNYELAATQAK